MAKKSMKDAAAAGTSVFEQIASGNTQQAQPTEERKEIKEVISVPTAPDAQDIQDIKDVQNTPDTQMRRRGRKPNPDKQPIERLNLKIPAALKQYLIIAAARASLEQERQISITEYICDLIADDKARHEEE
ncbi:MAG: hypothetical protein VZR27_10700 [Acutalibacteraceae bacterium]|nr:hypothetical protein [Acutalibacteraceae bacterium]